MGRKIIFSEAQIQNIIQKYNSGQSCLSIGKEYNCNNKTIRRLLDKHNIVNRGNRKHFYEEDIFKEINTAEKAYWLGFITADGYVNEDRGFMRIKLQECDKGHLYKFLKFIKGDEVMIKYEYHNITGNKQYYVEVNGRNFVKTLVDLEIRQRKSMNEVWCDKIPKKYIRDYIRGIVDGDGHIGHNRVDVCSSYKMLKRIKNYLKKHNIKTGDIVEHCSTNRIFICKDRVNLLKHLYYNNCIALDRKNSQAKSVAMNKLGKIGSDSLEEEMGVLDIVV